MTEPASDQNAFSAQPGRITGSVLAQILAVISSRSQKQVFLLMCSLCSSAILQQQKLLPAKKAGKSSMQFFCFSSFSEDTCLTFHLNSPRLPINNNLPNRRSLPMPNLTLSLRAIRHRSQACHNHMLPPLRQRASRRRRLHFHHRRKSILKQSLHSRKFSSES